MDSKVLSEDRAAAVAVVVLAVDMVVRDKVTLMDNKAPMAVRDRAVAAAALEVVAMDNKALMADRVVLVVVLEAAAVAAAKLVALVMDGGVKVWTTGSIICLIY